MSEQRPTQGTPPNGLCPTCKHVKVIQSAKGSVFLRCGLEREDPRYPKYPPQPVLSCRGFSG